MRKLIAVIGLFGLLVCSGLASGTSQEAAERVALGKKMLDQGKMEAAISEFEKATILDPKYGAAQLNLAHAYERSNRSEDAVNAYQKAIELEPRSIYAHNNLGVLYDKKGLYDQAIAEFQEALKLDSANAMALKNFETAKKNKLALEERNGVIANAEKGVEAKPNDPTPAYQLARVYATYGKKDAAIEWLGKAIRRGYKDIAYLKGDPAFAAMREERDFQLLLLQK